MPNMPRSRELVRLAVRLVDALEGATQGATIELPHVAWQRWRRTCERLRLALLRGWKSAAEKLQSDVRWQARSLTQAVQSLVNDLRSSSGRTATLREIYDDLVALDEEFEGFQFNLRDETLSVVMGPIVLEDVPLGRFEIQLRYGDLDRDHSYDVIALEADDDVEYTHPHVANEVLCEGDGADSPGGADLRAADHQWRWKAGVCPGCRRPAYAGGPGIHPDLGAMPGRRTRSSLDGRVEPAPEFFAVHERSRD